MKLLTLSTFPFQTPRHGGQHRLHNIVKQYQSFGCKVESVGVLGSHIYEHQEGFVPCPNHNELLSAVKNTFLMEDYAIGSLFANSDLHFSSLANCIKDIPQVIHVELPWLSSFARRFRESVGGRDIKIVYGSENIEHKLKHAILGAYLGEKDATACSELVRQCEMSAIRSADAICGVSQQDLDWIQQFTQAPCVLASNGVGKRASTIAGIESANRISERKKFALYCASAHPPNISGFFEIFEAGLGSLAPNQLLIVAGTAGKSIASHPLAERMSGVKSKLKIAGEVDEATLQGLLNAAHAVILPITQGEGTNLKTAEALWARKHIIATTKAMRGFERFTNSQGVFVRDAPTDFLRALQAVMSDEPLATSSSELPNRDVVLWEHTLSSLSAFID